MNNSNIARIDYVRHRRAPAGLRTGLQWSGAFALFAAYLLLPDATLRAVALWSLVGYGMLASLLQAWREW